MSPGAHPGLEVEDEEEPVSEGLGHLLPRAPLRLDLIAGFGKTKVLWDLDV